LLWYCQPPRRPAVRRQQRPFWSDPTERDRIEDMEAALGGSDRTKGF
jgi:hypothetical protein